jgi:hypothetical protein
MDEKDDSGEWDATDGLDELDGSGNLETTVEVHPRDRHPLLRAQWLEY